jgi:hypothetical protein
VRWVGYAFGARLPARHRAWVLHDLTTRHWRWRSLLRSLVQVLPIAVLVYLLLPAEPWVRVMAVLGGAAVGMIYAVAYLEEAAEHRALKAGYPRGALASVREGADAQARGSAAARYAQRYREGPTPRSSA